MASERMHLVALVALLPIAVYLVDGLLAGGIGVGLARVLVIAAGVVTAVGAPMVRRWLGRLQLRARTPHLAAMWAELAVQTSTQGVAEVLIARVWRLTGARAVSLKLGADFRIALPEALEGNPTVRFSLDVQGQPIGEVACYGKSRNERLVARLLPYGALALQNARLAEQASAAERVRNQAQNLRDLRHRLTWTVTTQLCALLDDTREHLEAVRLCSETLPPDLLGQELEAISVRLRRLEAFVHVNLKNANSIQAPAGVIPLARFTGPR